MQNQKVKLELTKDEAIILFEIIDRLNKSDGKIEIQDQAEQRMFWNIECLLEKELEEPFCNNYNEIVELAKKRLRDKEQ